MLTITELLGESIAKMNEQNLHNLKGQIASERVTWILGAGVSKSAGVPLWSECLLGMWSRILLLKSDHHSSAFQEALNSLKGQTASPDVFIEKVRQAIEGKRKSSILSGVNTLEAAEYIQNYITEALKTYSFYSDELRDLSYASLVRDSLKPKGTPENIFNHLKEQSLGLLARYFTERSLCGKRTFVISYNFDNLLEFALEKNGLEQKYCHIKRPGVQNTSDCDSGVHIYHPHGAVSVIPTSFSKESKRLILTESSYERLEQKVYLWENSIQANALQNTSCIFLGFSGEDYNFRRILKNMEYDSQVPKRRQHYLFLSIESLVKNIFSDEVNKRLLGNISRTEKERSEYLNNISKQQFDAALSEILADPDMFYERMLIIKKLYAQSLYWKHYNIIPIWTTRQELPEMLKQIIINKKD